MWNLRVLRVLGAKFVGSLGSVHSLLSNCSNRADLGCGEKNDSCLYLDGLLRGTVQKGCFPGQFPARILTDLPLNWH